MTSIKQQLESMLKRCISLHGYTLKEVDGKVVQVGKDEAVKEFITTLASQSGGNMQELADKIKAAHEGDATVQMALNAARVEAVSNYIASESTFRSGFFSLVTLGPADEPFYTNETKNEIRVSVMGQDGKPEQVRIVPVNSRTNVALHSIASDIVRWKTLDLLRGDVSKTIQDTIDIGGNLAFQLDRKHYTLLTASVANGGAFGAFSTEQAKSNKAERIYLAHSGIVTSHLPTTNDILNGTTGGPSGTRYTVQYYDPVYATDGTTPSDYTGFRPAVLMAIDDYCNCWGKVLPGGGRLVPTGDIIVPSSDIIGMAQYMDPTNVDKTQARMQQDIIDSGYTSLSFMGKTWRFIPDVTIAAGTCYPLFNLKPGLTYEKPSWDKEFQKRDDVENWEERWQRKAYGAVIPSQWRVRAMRIKYIA